MASTNFILSFYYEDFHNLVNTATIPTTLHSQITAIALLIEEIHVSINHNHYRF